MKRSHFVPFLSVLLLLIAAGTAFPQKKSAEPREMDFDEAGSEETLNRQLWEYSKKSSYKKALKYVARAQALSRQTRPAAANTLPNGWRIAPAGEQVSVGRLPMEAVPFAGNVVVLNTGYYSGEPQQVSVVEPNSRRVVKVLRLAGLFPS